MKQDQLSQERLVAAGKIVHSGHLYALERSHGKTPQMYHALWEKAQKDKAFRLAMVRIMIASGQITILTAAEAQEAQSDKKPFSSATILFAAHDPLSAVKMEAAKEVFGSAMMKAVHAIPDDIQRSRGLVWAWARQNLELETAILRLACRAITNVTVIRPDIEPDSLTLH